MRNFVAQVLPRRWSDRATAVRRDLEMLRHRLSGGPATVLVERRPRSAVAPVVPLWKRAISPRPMRVTRVVPETDDAVSIYLQELDGGPLRFTPGQFLSLDVDVDGRVLRRAYSLASATGHEPHITVKRIPGGCVSTQLVERCRVGDVLPVLGPSGVFGAHLAELANLPRHAVFIAGGSGITPIASILETLLAQDGIRVTLLYGNRSEADVIFAARLEALAETHRDRLRVDHVLQMRKGSGATGLLDAAVLAERFEALSHLDDDHTQYFLCGPTPMMEAAHVALVAVDPARIHEERFTRPQDRVTPVTSEREPVRLRIATPGGEREVFTRNETVLEAGLSAGIAMPFSCAMGGCAACKVLVLEGEVEMEEPNCLTAAERAEGYVLACVGRPNGACHVRIP